MRKQELKSRKKVHAHKRSKKSWHTGAYSTKKTEFVEYEPEVITIRKVKKPRNA